MTVHPIPAPPRDALPEEDVAYYRGALHALIDIGVDLARLVQVRAHQADVAGPGLEATEAVAAATVAFDRVSRAVRRTVWLARRLDEPVADPRRARPGDRGVARRRVLREVEDAIHRDWTAPESDSLEAELRERMDAPELDDELDHRPVEEIIAEICRDLGLGVKPGSVPWKRRTPEDVAVLFARAGRGRAGPVKAEEPERFFRIVAVPDGS